VADRCAHSETLPNQQEPPHAGLSLPAYENTLSIPPDDRFFSPPIIEMIPDTLQFWFMTGYQSHGHTGRIIIRQKDNPHIQFDSV